ncbi:hypothetical protein [Planotetraspora sp. GP83]|uniref:hypothetical protein n=1 Tax=Planotetraspora sp. GP83 TaxID=3156264 RepID=UPI003514F684
MICTTWSQTLTTGRLPLFDEDTVLVISEWEYAGKGFSPGDALVATLTATWFADGGQ